MEWNKQKICFVICANNDTLSEECLFYLSRLEFPAGIETELLVIREAPSMLEGYREAAESTDAYYKVFLHQDVFVLNRHLISDLLRIFQSDSSIGMVGMVGTGQLPKSGVMWDGERIGKIFMTGDPTDYDGYHYDIKKDGITEVMAVDGLLIAVAGACCLRMDLFDGWDFYDVSMSLEMKRSGKKVVVPSQRYAWVLHDDGGILDMTHYDHYRRIAKKEYAEYFL